MSDKIVYTVPGYKLLKDLQNEILEENELESRFNNNSSYHKSSKNPRSKLSLPQKPHTILFSELASPSHNLLSTMKDNLNITSLLLKNKKPNTASGLTNERLKTLTFNSNFSTTNNFFTNKVFTQELDVTTLSRIAIRNSKQRKIAINVNEARNAMIPAGHSRLPDIIKEKKSCGSGKSCGKSCANFSASNKLDLLRLRHDEAKLEKIIASNEQKKREIEEIHDLVKKKILDKSEFNKEYFNKKDPFWRSFFEENKAIEQNEACNKHFQRRMNERIQGYQDDKYRKPWMNLHVGKHKSEKTPLMFGREDLRRFEEILKRLRKDAKNSEEIYAGNREELKRSRTNLSKLSSSETRMEKE